MMSMGVVAEVRAVVVAIPSGCVAAYGEIGRAVGIGPRQTGRAVALLDEDVPWWRVVHADGSPATCHEGGARVLLEVARQSVRQRRGIRVDGRSLHRRARRASASFVATVRRAADATGLVKNSSARLRKALSA